MYELVLVYMNEPIFRLFEYMYYSAILLLAIMITDLEFGIQPIQDFFRLLVSSDLSFASTETKFKNPITKTQNDFFVNTVFLVKLFQKKPK